MAPGDSPAPLESPQELVRRLRRNAKWALVVLAVLAGLVTRSVGAVAGVVLAGLLMLANFKLLHSIIDPVLERGDVPGIGQTVLLLGRLVLMALLLGGIILLPGVGPIPVALGLSVLVLAVLVEALTYAFSGWTDK